MTLGGWLFICISWAFILGLLIFCFQRVLGKKK
jgi:hypothetical protein